MESASRRYPSFSSTLLDHIYRSIDNDNDHDHEQPPPTQSQSIHTKFRPSFEDDDAHKQPLTGRKSAADDLQMRYAPTDQSFSTGLLKLKLKLKPKPIRRDDDIMKLPRNKQDSKTKQKDEGKFVKTRLKALKIYGDLKKVKQQPISPGGRLATFLNSLFINNNNNNNKKPNTDAAGLDRKSKSANASTCSSASSVSRSSVSSSNIPSSRPTLSKRSVRFYPEYCQPSSLHQHQTKLNNKLNLSTDHTHKNRHISEAARNLLKNYQNKVEFDSTRNINAFENQTHDDDDDGGSDSSSDLFELENLSASRYRQELPVYETTRLDTNPLFM